MERGDPLPVGSGATQVPRRERLHRPVTGRPLSEDAARAYARAVADRLDGVLGDDLLGVYLVGSLALGGYEPGRSDVDIAALVRGALSPQRKRAVVEAVGHDALPCPARKLELVVSVPERLPDFELNLNSGEHEHTVEVRPEAASAFWFALDVSIARVSGVPLSGPPAADAFPELARDLVERAVAAAIRWQIANRVPADDLVLNACRARRFLDEGVWSSKLEAGRWARRRLGQADVVEAALAVRRGEPDARLEWDAAVTFARTVPAAFS
jgi:predicted nucleotidyltransferase